MKYSQKSKLESQYSYPSRFLYPNYPTNIGNLG